MLTASSLAGVEIEHAVRGPTRCRSRCRSSGAALPCPAAVGPFVPAQLAQQLGKGRCFVDHEQLDPRDRRPVADRLDSDCGGEHAVVRAARGEPGLGGGEEVRPRPPERARDREAWGGPRSARRRRSRWRPAGSGRRGRASPTTTAGPGRGVKTSRTGSSLPPMPSGWISHDGCPRRSTGRSRACARRGSARTPGVEVVGVVLHEGRPAGEPARHHLDDPARSAAVFQSPSAPKP